MSLATVSFRSCKFRLDHNGKEQKNYTEKNWSKSFLKKHSINALHRPAKLTIAEVDSILGGQDILYSYVATKNDHTVHTVLPLYKGLEGTSQICLLYWRFIILKVHKYKQQ